MGMRIAIQGIKGSNHHQVAMDYFNNDIELVECRYFHEMVDTLLEDKADRAVMAIENSIAGSIIPNYNLVSDNKLHIIGEHYIQISHHLMVLNGQEIGDIKEVRSHPMALLQCREYLKSQSHIKMVEDVDTAETARDINDNKLMGVAAIAPEMASELYGLKIIARDIQTIKNNATRFIVLSRKNSAIPEDKIDKASLRFLTDHKRGSLATVLNVMSDCNLNLTKIQSLPIIETPWKYAFFVDMTFEKYEHYHKAKSLLEIMTEGFMVMGEYTNAKL